MIEGWAGDRHFIVGLLGWDDFIVRSSSGDLFTVPTVPLVGKYLAPFRGELPRQLAGDHRAGTIKWYVKPVVFGGEPESGENMIWVDHDKHAELVLWWNKQYQTIIRLQETSRA